MEKKVLEYIRKYHLLAMDKPVLVALSGGADSVALLRVLQNLGFHCAAAHCNFQLRGEESCRDERFVKDLCEQLDVTCHVMRFDTTQYAKKQKISIEMAARELRYDYFNRLMCEMGIDAVAVAHHRGDQAETLLLNLLRGAGIQGLRGMKPLNGKVVRPLLSCTKEEILRFLRDCHQSYVTDSSNFKDEPLRNKIRLQVMPILATINPQAEAALCRSADCLLQADCLMGKAVDAELQLYKMEDNVYQRVMSQLPYSGILLHKWLSNYNFNYAQLEQIIDSSLSDCTGRRFDSPSHTLWIDRDKLICTERTDTVDMPDLQMCCFSADEITITPDSNVAFLDADKLCLPLNQRFIGNGDRFVPLGMRGSRLVSDFMTDQKCSPLEKQRQTVLTDAEGRIVWLVGRRIDNRFKWTKQTKHIIRIAIT